MSVQSGSIRFNTDSLRLEIYNGEKWWEIDSTSPDQQTGGTRAIIAAGYNGSSYINNIDFFNVDSTGNAQDFGDTQDNAGWLGACADRTRGIFFGDGNSGGGSNVISFITISSQGNAADFGDLTDSRNYFGGLADRTRGIRGGGYGPNPTYEINTIDYITIQSEGNAIDFGDLVNTAHAGGKLTHGAGVSSPTRGMWGGGAYYAPNAVVMDNIDFITISTLGNAADFGDLTLARKAVTGVANAVRGVWSGGYTPTYQDTQDFVTLATLGNAIDFGDSTWAGAYKSGASSPTRGCYAGGRIPSGRENRIDYITLMSTGDATDFGDLVSNHDGAGGCSNGHGGLG
jgi:hypothetical protein